MLSLNSDTDFETKLNLYVYERLEMRIKVKSQHLNIPE